MRKKQSPGENFEDEILDLDLMDFPSSGEEKLEAFDLVPEETMDIPIEEFTEEYIEYDTEELPTDFSDGFAVIDFEEEKEEEDDEEEEPRSLRGQIASMDLLSKCMAITGVAIILLAVISAGLFLKSDFVKQLSGQVSLAEVGQTLDTSPVGAALDGVTFVGQQGIEDALARKMEETLVAQTAALEAEAQAAAQENSFEEVAYVTDTVVSLETISVKKDLKIKFVNKSTKKLIANVPFSLTVTYPDGKKETWTDDDMDGVIYRKKIAGGDYKIHLDPLEGEKYAQLTLPGDQSAKVLEEMSYKKVEVADEVKKASEVNEAKEDTGRGGAGDGDGSTLKDTVTYVDSSAGAGDYQEISKDSIEDPMLMVKLGSFRRLAQVNASADTQAENAASEVSAQITAEVSPETSSESVTGTGAEDSATEVVPTDGTVTTGTEATEAGNTTATATEAGNTTATATEADNTTATATEAGNTTATTTETGNTQSKIKLSADSIKVYVGTDSGVEVAFGEAGMSYTVSAGEEEIVTLTQDGNKVLLHGETPGSMTLTFTATTADGKQYVTTCAVTVEQAPQNNSEKTLKDKNGNTVYVLEDGKYREAKYADYYTATAFYIAADLKYTGWQVLDGHTYYYNEDGTKVTGVQVIQGVKYTFDSSTGALQAGSGTKGVDVSKWNGAIDWNAVAKAGISYAIIRVGYRGSSQGALIDDASFATNVKGATAAGLKVGVYFYTQAIDEVEALYEASMVLDRIAGFRITYPVFLDVEGSGGRADGIDAATRTAVCNTFLETIRGGGYTAGIYANKTWFTEKINTGSLKNAVIWLAQYASEVTYGGHYDIWQYTEKGSVSGIKGKVDVNLSYLGY